MASNDVSSIESPKIEMQAWYMDDSDEDQRLPHHLDPKQYVSHSTLSELGVLHWVIDADNYEQDPLLAKIKKDRGYTYQDIIDIAPDRLPNYEAKLKTFFEEHIHDDEEIRFILDGSGYFDVRDLDDRWIRVWTQKGHMIVLPAGIYHRFTLDSTNYIKALRLFVGDPVWTPHNRPQEEREARKDYIALFKKDTQIGIEAH